MLDNEEEYAFLYALAYTCLTDLACELSRTRACHSVVLEKDAETSVLARTDYKIGQKYVIATYNSMSCELIILYTVMLENNHNIALSEEY